MLVGTNKEDFTELRWMAALLGWPKTWEVSLSDLGEVCEKVEGRGVSLWALTGAYVVLAATLADGEECIGVSFS